MAFTPPKTDFAPGDILNAAQMNDIGENLEFIYTGVVRLGFGTRTTDYVATATTTAAAADIFSSDITFTADGTSTYFVEFYTMRVINPGSSGPYLSLMLVTGAGTALGSMGLVLGTPPGAQGSQAPIHLKVPFTPAAGSTSVNIRGVRSGADFTIAGGNGGTALTDPFPMWMAVYGPDVT